LPAMIISAFVFNYKFDVAHSKASDSLVER